MLQLDEFVGLLCEKTDLTLCNKAKEALNTIIKDAIVYKQDTDAIKKITFENEQKAFKFIFAEAAKIKGNNALLEMEKTATYEKNKTLIDTIRDVIKSTVGSMWNVAKRVVSAVWGVLKQVANTIYEKLKQCFSTPICWMTAVVALYGLYCYLTHTVTSNETVRWVRESPYWPKTRVVTTEAVDMYASGCNLYKLVMDYIFNTAPKLWIYFTETLQNIFGADGFITSSFQKWYKLVTGTNTELLSTYGFVKDYMDMESTLYKMVFGLISGGACYGIASLLGTVTFGWGFYAGIAMCGGTGYLKSDWLNTVIVKSRYIAMERALMRPFFIKWMGDLINFFSRKLDKWLRGKGYDFEITDTTTKLYDVFKTLSKISSLFSDQVTAQAIAVHTLFMKEAGKYGVMNLMPSLQADLKKMKDKFSRNKTEKKLPTVSKETLTRIIAVDRIKEISNLSKDIQYINEGDLYAQKRFRLELFGPILGVANMKKLLISMSTSKGNWSSEITKEGVDVLWNKYKKDIEYFFDVTNNKQTYKDGEEVFLKCSQNNENPAKLVKEEVFNEDPTTYTHTLIICGKDLKSWKGTIVRPLLNRLYLIDLEKKSNDGWEKYGRHIVKEDHLKKTILLLEDGDMDMDLIKFKTLKF